MVKVKRSIKTDLVVILSIIIVTLVILISAVANFTLKSNIDKEVKDGLEGVVYSVLDVFEMGTDGDITKDSAGNLKKGDLTIGLNNEFADSIKEHTDTDVTIFSEETRVSSSIIDSNGNRVVGTKASEKVIEEVINKGNSYFDKKVNVQGRNYYGYYAPIKNKSGEIIGMTFAGKPTKDIDSLIYRNFIIITGIGIFGTIVAIIVAYRKLNSIVKSIKYVCEYLETISKGDLSKSIDKKYIDRQDEIGLIVQVSEKLREELKTLIGKILEASKSLIHHSSQLESISSVCLENTEALNKAMDDMSNGAVFQAENTQSASEKSIYIGELIKLITNSVDDLENSTGSISDAESDADKIIRDSSTYNNITISSVTRIAEQTEKTNEAVKKIKSAIEVITDIAEQTNLLSLNASIEAEKAGESGKGFVVVAEEIQNLAEESNNSAKTIEQSIGELLEQSDKTVSIMKDVQEAVDNQKIKITETKNKFEVVSNAVIKSVEDIHKITNQAEKLEKVKDSIIDAMQNLAAIAEENAASTEETTASMNELTNIIENVSKSSGTLKDLAQDLERSVEIFKI